MQDLIPLRYGTATSLVLQNRCRVIAFQKSCGYPVYLPAPTEPSDKGIGTGMGERFSSPGKIDE